MSKVNYFDIRFCDHDFPFRVPLYKNLTHLIIGDIDFHIQIYNVVKPLTHKDPRIHYGLQDVVRKVSRVLDDICCRHLKNKQGQ